jgi:hypothetical protein
MSIEYLDFKMFPFATCVIKIPKKFCFFRTGNNDPAKETAPRWFSDHINASSYFTMYPKMFVCRGKVDIKVLDIRLMKYTVLEALLENAQVVDSLKGSPTTAKLQECIQAFMKVFGFVPGKEQYGSDSNNRPFPFSAYGYRWSDNSVDNKAVALLKYIFYPHIQGYIAPMLKRHDTIPFHQELCLFVPSSVLDGPSEIIQKNDYTNRTRDLVGKQLELSREFMVMDGGGKDIKGLDQGPGNVQGQEPGTLSLMSLHNPAASQGQQPNDFPAASTRGSSGPLSTNGSSGRSSINGSFSRQPSNMFSENVFPASAKALAENAQAKKSQVKGYQLSCNDNLCSECNDNIVFNSEELGVLELIKNSVMSQIII